MNRATRKRIQRLLDRRPAALPADPIQARAIQLSDDQFRATLRLLTEAEPPEQMALALWQSLREATEAAQAEADQLFGPQGVECAAGCSWCCHEPLQVSILDAIGVAHHLLPEGRIRDYSLPSREGDRLKAIFMACPMLGPDGRCTVYFDRPVVCRAYHGQAAARCQANFQARDARRDVPLHLGLFGFAGLPQDGAQAALAEAGLDCRPVVLGLAVARLLEDFAGLCAGWLAGQRVFDDVVVEAPRVRKLDHELPLAWK